MSMYFDQESFETALRDSQIADAQAGEWKQGNAIRGLIIASAMSLPIWALGLYFVI